MPEIEGDQVVASSEIDEVGSTNHILRSFAHLIAAPALPLGYDRTPSDPDQ